MLPMAGGERNVVDGDLNLLQGFEFNAATSLDEVMKAAYTVGFDRVSGLAAIAIQFEDPSLELQQVEGATQARFTVGLAAVNFETGDYEVDVVHSESVEIASKAAVQVDIEAGISANSEQPVFLVLGVEYYQAVNGELYLINNKESRALLLATVDMP